MTKMTRLAVLLFCFCFPLALQAAQGDPISLETQILDIPTGLLFVPLVFVSAFSGCAVCFPALLSAAALIKREIPSSTESDLWNRMTIMLAKNGVNEFGAALEQIGRIKKIVAENKPPYWTPQETAAKLAEFVNKNNRMPNWTIAKKERMPQRLEGYDPEVLLVENMFYWRIYSRDFQESLGQIERKFRQTHQ